MTDAFVQDVIYLMVVNMPSDEELAEAAKWDREFKAAQAAGQGQRAEQQ